MSKLKQIFTYIKRLFPDPKTELIYNMPFQLVVAVILSAQTTDIQVNKATSNLFKNIYTPQNIIQIGQSKLIKSISSINYYKTKGKNIFLLSKLIVDSKKVKDLGIEKWNTYEDKNNIYFIPNTIEGLKKLPGIGEKTAKVVAHVLFGAPVIAVDTHVHRVCNRLGIVSTKTPEQTSKLLENIIPKQYKSIAHHSIILFGRYYCTAKKPKCETCELQSICKRYQSIKK
ncbi:hypothetical protein P148_SR1C00001G0505 [candidate division SR1 bacterium RAAC1_SR1_1]|nr:hypothetical protein P148_SR1C00001G0505 [candidate division SR1 bacterium RAAC1_SR1_1]